MFVVLLYNCITSHCLVVFLAITIEIYFQVSFDVLVYFCISSFLLGLVEKNAI